MTPSTPLYYYKKNTVSIVKTNDTEIIFFWQFRNAKPFVNPSLFGLRLSLLLPSNFAIVDILPVLLPAAFLAAILP